MLKDNIRDYSISAFRYYAVITKFNRKTPDRVEIPNTMNKAEVLDLLAVKKTIESLEKMKNGKNRVEILDLVYFSEPNKPLKRNDITHRVHKASLQFFFSERQIYYYLREAVEIFARERELRIGK